MEKNCKYVDELGSDEIQSEPNGCVDVQILENFQVRQLEVQK